MWEDQDGGFRLMLTIIAAIGKNNELGYKNKMLWYLPDDLKRFRKITTGHTLIMGRKTFESLPKLLPERRHIIITRNSSYQVKTIARTDSPVIIFHSIEEMLKSLKPEEEYFVIGGGELYRQLLPYSEKIYLTIVKKEFTADTFFPEIDYNQWEIIEKKPGIEDEKNRLPHNYITLKRK